MDTVGFRVPTKQIKDFSPHEIFFALPDSFLAISSQSPSTVVFRTSSTSEN
jgi:hypothetical protein